MAVDFFANCNTDISISQFGLCDDTPPPHTPAYCKTSDPHLWIAIVDNPGNLTVTFTALDHCVIIYRKDDPKKQESLCDCMLTYSDRIVFVELKDRDYPGVIGEAKDQLGNTIQLFSESHNLFAYKKRRAFISNKKKPNFPHSRMDEMQEFKKKYNVILVPDVSIKIN